MALNPPRRRKWKYRIEPRSPTMRLLLQCRLGTKLIPLPFGQVRISDPDDAILARRALAYFLDGQYDKAIEDMVNFRDSSNVKRDQELLRARVYAARGSYEEALKQYSEFLDHLPAQLSAGDFSGNPWIEVATLHFRFGHMKEAQHFLTAFIWPSYRMGEPKVFHIRDFEQQVQSRSQEDLFPWCPKGYLDLVFFIMPKEPDAPPIIRIMKSVELANATIEIAMKLGAENKLSAGAWGQQIPFYPISILACFMFALRATSEQAAGFIKQMRARYDIEQLECFNYGRFQGFESLVPY